jgi:hypothetical protein
VPPTGTPPGGKPDTSQVPRPQEEPTEPPGEETEPPGEETVPAPPDTTRPGFR